MRDGMGGRDLWHRRSVGSTENYISVCEDDVSCVGPKSAV